MTTSHRSFAICSGFVIVHELERITYKLAVLAYQCLRRLAPTYLADALQPVAQIHGRQRLRSSSTSALAVVSTINTVLYDLWPSFQVATAQTGKSLPSEVTSSETVQVFKSDHKTHLFPLPSHLVDCCKVIEVHLSFFTQNCVYICMYMSMTKRKIGDHWGITSSSGLIKLHLLERPI